VLAASSDAPAALLNTAHIGANTRVDTCRPGDNARLTVRLAVARSGARTGARVGARKISGGRCTRLRKELVSGTRPGWADPLGVL